MNKSNACHHGVKEIRKMCISIVPIFNHLEPARMEEIVKTTTSLKFEKGETIYRAGDVSEQLYIVHKGLVKIYRLSETGKEQLIRVLEPGDFTGELSLFSASVHDSYAEAMETTEICMMNRADLQQFLLKYPEISLKVLTEFSNRLAETEKQAASIAMDTVDKRLASYIISLFEKTKEKTITLPMSRKDLASYLGTSPETISRKLTEFEKEEWIYQTNRRNIRIIDVEALMLV